MGKQLITIRLEDSILSKVDAAAQISGDSRTSVIERLLTQGMIDQPTKSTVYGRMFNQITGLTLLFREVGSFGWDPMSMKPEDGVTTAVRLVWVEPEGQQAEGEGDGSLFLQVIDDISGDETWYAVGGSRLRECNPMKYFTKKQKKKDAKSDEEST